MADTSLTVTPGTSSSGQDPVTQESLQPSAPGNLSNGISGAVQPGVTGDQLSSTGGISITPGALSTVDLNSSTTATTSSTTQPTPTQHINPVLVGLCVLFFIVAIVMFFITNQSSKKHNQYK